MLIDCIIIFINTGFSLIYVMCQGLLIRSAASICLYSDPSSDFCCTHLLSCFQYTCTCPYPHCSLSVFSTDSRCSSILILDGHIPYFMCSFWQNCVLADFEILPLICVLPYAVIRYDMARYVYCRVILFLMVYWTCFWLLYDFSLFVCFLLHCCSYPLFWFERSSLLLHQMNVSVHTDVQGQG
jgi:hypothetical protein